MHIDNDLGSFDLSMHQRLSSWEVIFGVSYNVSWTHYRSSERLTFYFNFSFPFDPIDSMAKYLTILTIQSIGGVLIICIVPVAFCFFAGCSIYIRAFYQIWNNMLTQIDSHFEKRKSKLNANRFLIELATLYLEILEWEYIIITGSRSVHFVLNILAVLQSEWFIFSKE